MSWVFSLLVSLVCGLAGLVTSGVVAAAYADWYRMSTHEGKAGFFVVGMALLGGMVACVLGFVVGRLLGTEDAAGFFKAAGVACAVVLVAGGVTASALYLLADFPPTLEGEEMMLEVEIRLPKDGGTDPVRMKGDASFVLDSVVNNTQRASQHGRLQVAGAREEEGRWIVPAEVFLFTSRGRRAVEARIGDEVLGAFLVPLPARPGADFERWSGWLPAPPAGSPPWPETKASFRFRVKRIPPPAPPPTAEQAAEEKEREEQGAFDAIPPDSPIGVWLPYTPSWQNEARRTAALGRITGRPDFVRELGAMMLAGDNREAGEAMRLVGELPSPDPALVPAVRAAGRDVIERMKKCNASPVEQDPTFEGAADVSVRFSSWMTAARVLREKAGADFVPELAEILDLSRVRTDSHCMQQDVRRVASYYMKEWAGVEPLPGDPPPR